MYCNWVDDDHSHSYCQALEPSFLFLVSVFGFVLDVACPCFSNHRPFYCNANLFRIVTLVPIVALLGFVGVMDLFVLGACDRLGDTLDFVLVCMDGWMCGLVGLVMVKCDIEQCLFSHVG